MRSSLALTIGPFGAVQLGLQITAEPIEQPLRLPLLPPQLLEHIVTFIDPKHRVQKMRRLAACAASCRSLHEAVEAHIKTRSCVGGSWKQRWELEAWGRRHHEAQRLSDLQWRRQLDVLDDHQADDEHSVAGDTSVSDENEPTDDQSLANDDQSLADDDQSLIDDQSPDDDQSQPDECQSQPDDGHRLEEHHEEAYSDEDYANESDAPACEDHYEKAFEEDSTQEEQSAESDEQDDQSDHEHDQHSDSEAEQGQYDDSEEEQWRLEMEAEAREKAREQRRAENKRRLFQRYQALLYPFWQQQRKRTVQLLARFPITDGPSIDITDFGTLASHGPAMLTPVAAAAKEMMRLDRRIRTPFGQSEADKERTHNMVDLWVDRSDMQAFFDAVGLLRYENSLETWEALPGGGFRLMALEVWGDCDWAYFMDEWDATKVVPDSLVSHGGRAWLDNHPSNHQRSMR